MHSVELDSFPANENPFWHDAISMGMQLSDALPVRRMNGTSSLDGVYIMASGMNSRYDFYVVDKKTGKRLGICLNRNADTSCSEPNGL